MAFHFGSLFGQKNPPLIGLDIGSSAIRLVELSAPLKNIFRLEHCASEALPHGAVVDGNIENIAQVTDAIHRVLIKSGSKARLVALGMPPAVVITKKIILPGGMSDDELEIQVENEAGQYIPFTLDEVSLDFDVLGIAPNAPDDIEILLAATRKEKVEDRIAVAEAVGLQPRVMDIESYAARAVTEHIGSGLEGGSEGKIIALFQIGANVTHVSMQLDGQVLYEREQPFGGSHLTQDIARAYGLSFEEAESKKRSNELSAEQSTELPTNYEREYRAPFIESAAAEIARAIQFFFTATPYTRVDQIYLAGGCAVMPGLRERVAVHTRCACAVMNPFEGMQVAPSVREKQLAADAPAFLVACGLAMRRFDQ